MSRFAATRAPKAAPPLALCKWHEGSPRSPTPGRGFWLLADGGYSWAAAQHLVLTPGLGADQDKAGALGLGTLAPRGGFFRLAAVLSYD
jgi:hypothetical protein